MNDKVIDINNAEEEFLQKALFEDNDLIEMKLEKVQETIEQIAEIHGEASCLIAAENALVTDKKNFEEGFNNRIEEVFEGDTNYLPQTLLKLEFYEKELIKLRNFFRYEKIRYEKNSKNQYDKKEFEKRIEEIWDKAIKKNSGAINNKCRYPIRKRIEHIFKDFVEKVIENRKQLRPDNNEYDEFWLKIEVYELLRNKDSLHWYRFIRIMQDILSFFRDEKPGTYGHLLWIYLYISEISYFYSTSSEDFYQNRVDYIREAQLATYWKEFMLNEESLRIVFDSFVEIQENKVIKTNNRMMMCYTKNKISYRDCKEDYKRIKSILYRDKTLRKEFIYTKSSEFEMQGTNGARANSKGSNGRRCFSILTDGKKKYVAISGNNQDLYKLCKAIFYNKCSKKYKFIDWNDYAHSLYVWTDKMGINELNQLQTEKRVKNKRISPPKSYKRMFSCAERRLVEQCIKEGNNSKFIIISRKNPCYMCERVLKHKNIKCKSFEAYVEKDANIQNELDSFAKKIY